MGWSGFETRLGVERVFRVWGRGSGGICIEGLGGAGCKEE